MSAPAPPAPPLSPYHRRLFVFLSVATFFEGYDFFALGQILPNMRAEMGLSEAQGGTMVGIIGIGTMLSYAVVRLADRWGRRRVLAITILAYALFTFLTGVSQTAFDFTAYQLLARIFLIAEWALSMVYAAEEFPAARRGFLIGVIQAFNALGSIVCAAVVPLLLNTPYGWRSVYFVGVIPLLLLAYARRGLRETRRFEEMLSKDSDRKRGLFEIFAPAARTGPTNRSRIGPGDETRTSAGSEWLRDRHVRTVGILFIVFHSLTLIAGISLLLTVRVSSVIQQIGDALQARDVLSIILSIIGMTLGFFFAAVALTGLIAGVALLRGRLWSRKVALIVAFLDLVNLPLGTILGIYTIRALVVRRSPYGKRVFQMAAIWGFTYMCTQPAVIFWKEFAVAERGFTDGQVGLAIAVASLVSLPLAFFVGKGLDAWGRRRGAMLIYGSGVVFVVGAYHLHGFWLLTASLTGAIFAAVALLTLLNTLTTELFPTEMRGDAFAWANNLLGRIGYVIAPAIVGAAAATVGWGNATSATVVFLAAALGLILWLIPETSRRELEDTARI